MPGQPPPFELTPLPTPGQGVRWELPRRPWGSAWIMPWIFMIAGVFVAGVFGITSLPNLSGNASAFSFVFNIIWTAGQAIASLSGLALILGGLFMLRGRTTVILKPSELITIDRLGPLYWTRRVLNARITGFEISIGTSSTNGGPEKPTNNVTCLIAQTDLPARFQSKEDKDRDDNPTHNFFAAWAYPKDWMQQLADAITDNARIAPHLADLQTTITIEHGSEFVDDQNPVEKPTDTHVLLARQPDGITIEVPPSGWLRGSKGIGFFALLWNGFILLFTAVLIFVFLAPGSGSTGADPLWFLLFLVPFAGVGIGVGAYAAHLGKSRSSLVVVGTGPESVLAFHRISPVRKPLELTWPTTELSHIRVGASNMTVNDQPVMELQIHPKRGKKEGILAQLDDEVLRWIAYELRQQTGLPQSAITNDKEE